ncbi:zinc-dependent alcohol dehydrogenase [Bryobacter aggregatus]|uniref:zinc-dependent alcohol dehydrogenase n=1 Tax=Bryobacter aggregatus TaxID=360054 RepID=UPI0004E20020|nr:galactitol-1-phosphate 5-dehydrogenase [Bryobacter aggregatus]
MKALLLSEYKQLNYTDMPVPTIGAEDVLIQVKACGICGSDIHGWDGSTGRRVPPLVMGHEASGEITEVGSAVKGWKAGDRVTFDSTVSCGHCYFCTRGEINLCDNRQVLGVSCNEFRRHGAFAEYVTVPQNILYSLPESFPFHYAAMIEAVSIAVHAVNLTPIPLGSSALVVGSGMIGLLVVQTLRLAGCGQIIAVDLEDSKLELAKSLGADIGLNPKKTDVIKAVHELTGGRGADVAIEVVGASKTIETAIMGVKKGGTVTLVGNITPKVEIPLQVVVSRQIRLQGSAASSGEFPQCIELLARGAIKVDPIISALAPLEDGAKWFERLYANEPGLMKVVLQPGR